MDDLDILGFFAGGINLGANFQIADLDQWFAHQPRPPLRLVVRFSTQSATRLTEIASVAMATAG